MVSLGRAVFWWETARFLFKRKPRPIRLLIGTSSQGVREVRLDCPLQHTFRRFSCVNGTGVPKRSFGKNLFIGSLESRARHFGDGPSNRVHRPAIFHPGGHLRPHGIFANQALRRRSDR